MPHDYIFKFITVGNHGTQFLHPELSWLNPLTDDFRIVPKIISIDYKPDIKFTLRILDTTLSYTLIEYEKSKYRGAAGALLVYDITSRETFDGLAYWFDVLRKHGNANMIITLVGDKCDLADMRVVSTEEGEQFAKEHDLLFVETSAKTAQNIEEVLSKTAVTLYKKIQDKEAFIKTVAAEYEKIHDEEFSKNYFDWDWDADSVDYEFIHNDSANSVDLISHQRGRSQTHLYCMKTTKQESEKEIEKLEKERSELKKAVKERNEVIQKMFEDCQALLLKENKSEQVAKRATRVVDILGVGPTVSITTYEDEY